MASSHHTTGKLNERLREWYKSHPKEYPPVSICSHVRYRIWYRDMMAKKSMRLTPPKGGRHPKCLEGEPSTFNPRGDFVKTNRRYVPTY